jgi:hypothetical protein
LKIQRLTVAYSAYNCCRGFGRNRHTRTDPFGDILRCWMMEEIYGRMGHWEASVASS